MFGEAGEDLKRPTTTGKRWPISRVQALKSGFLMVCAYHFAKAMGAAFRQSHCYSHALYPRAITILRMTCKYAAGEHDTTRMSQCLWSRLTLAHHAQCNAATQSVAACATVDENVAFAFSKVMHMVAPPESLFSPRMLMKVLLFRLQQLLFGRQDSRQGDIMA